MIDRLDTALVTAVTTECAKRGGACNHTPDGLLCVNATFDPKAVIRTLLLNMREPTKEMAKDGGGQLFAPCSEDWSEDAVEVWQAMIDKALDNAPYLCYRQSHTNVGNCA